MSHFMLNPYANCPISRVAQSFPTWDESDSDARSTDSSSDRSACEADLGYSSGGSTESNPRRRATAEAEPAEQKPEAPIVPCYRTYHEDLKKAFLENQVANGVFLSEGEMRRVVESNSFMYKYDRIITASSFTNEIFDEDAKNLIGYLANHEVKDADKVIRHLVDLILPYVESIWRKLEVSNYLIHFLFFLGKKDETLPLQFALLPYLKEMMNHPHGNTTARGLLIHGHPVLEPTIRRIIQEPSTHQLLNEREKYGFYVLRWYLQYNQAWMEAHCAPLASAINAMDRKGQSANYRRN